MASDRVNEKWKDSEYIKVSDLEPTFGLGAKGGGTWEVIKRSSDSSEADFGQPFKIAGVGILKGNILVQA